MEVPMAKTIVDFVADVVSLMEHSQWRYRLPASQRSPFPHENLPLQLLGMKNHRQARKSDQTVFLQREPMCAETTLRTLFENKKVFASVPFFEDDSKFFVVHLAILRLPLYAVLPNHDILAIRQQVFAHGCIARYFYITFPNDDNDEPSPSKAEIEELLEDGWYCLT
ncbi:hypothetical protein EVG20_g11330 [Dentipellis fragilis]|uniref:Uncharacterized protein n=1 Tax=Dentipellis fragilis TaxID=205917 RepID=A0A4Y9XN41_9AGAM|nr:hypothetical protein EVG20_g11330 [Dentipellis fragilis]